MAHKITISEEVYEILKKRKKEKESFSDVIIWLTSGKGSIEGLLDYANSKYFSPISDETAETMRQASEEFRKNFKTRDFNL